MMSGNRIGVKTLDLGCVFSEIACQLNEVENDFIAQPEAKQPNL